MNWGENQSCTPSRVEYPGSAHEISSIVQQAAAAGERVKVVGTGHSFTDIAATEGVMLSLRRYGRVLEADTSSGIVKVEAGIRLSDLNHELAAMGLAIENLGDIEYQTLAGAIATSTHGTGARFGSISSQVAGIEVIAADGSTLPASESLNSEALKALKVNLGALGVVSTVTLQCVPAFTLYSEEKPWRLDEALESIDELVDSNDHVDFYWYPHTEVAQTLIHNRTEDSPRPRKRLKAYYEDILMENRTFNLVCYLGSLNSRWIPPLSRFIGSQIGHARITDRSDRVFTNPRTVRFVEMEYAVPRANGVAALREVRALIEKQELNISFPVEMRFLAPDDAFLSTAYGRDTVYIAVHVYYKLEFENYFREVEAIMRQHEGRPHWGKMHYRTGADLSPLYPEWDRFQAVRQQFDPEGVFANSYLERVLGTTTGG